MRPARGTAISWRRRSTTTSCGGSSWKECATARKSGWRRAWRDSSTRHGNGFQSTGDDPAEQQGAISAYLAARQVNDEFRRAESRPVLDRALLDRIDFIVPFFPIKERPLLARILARLLGVYGWEGCPPETQDRILDEAMAQTESVRPLKRLIKKYRRQALTGQSAEAGTAANKGA